ncbi:hypothetical protein SpCBS45565_g07224 [Spizellomyces sp. 'palustris']|nr:hypothetical protein SpCBS45565_g07224 [Spizellomyces sp. 'palustris']
MYTELPSACEEHARRTYARHAVSLPSINISRPSSASCRPSSRSSSREWWCRDEGPSTSDTVNSRDSQISCTRRDSIPADRDQTGIAIPSQSQGLLGQGESGRWHGKRTDPRSIGVTRSNGELSETTRLRRRRLLPPRAYEVAPVGRDRKLSRDNHSDRGDVQREQSGLRRLDSERLPLIHRLNDTLDEDGTAAAAEIPGWDNRQSSDSTPARDTEPNYCRRTDMCRLISNDHASGEHESSLGSMYVVVRPWGSRIRRHPEIVLSEMQDVSTDTASTLRAAPRGDVRTVRTQAEPVDGRLCSSFLLPSLPPLPSASSFPIYAAPFKAAHPFGYATMPGSDDPFLTMVLDPSQRRLASIATSFLGTGAGKYTSFIPYPLLCLAAITDGQQSVDVAPSRLGSDESDVHYRSLSDTLRSVETMRLVLESMRPLLGLRPSSEA